MEKKPKVLVISYYWYPFAGVGTYRVSRFVKYLQRLGWEVVVLTAKKASSGHRADPDDPLLARVKVYRSSIIEPTQLLSNKNSGGFLSASDVDDIVVPFGHGHSANGASEIAVRNILPRAAPVFGAPDPPTGRTEVEKVVLPGHACNGGRAATSVRAHQSILKTVIERGIYGLGGRFSNDQVRQEQDQKGQGKCGKGDSHEVRHRMDWHHRRHAQSNGLPSKALPKGLPGGED